MRRKIDPNLHPNDHTKQTAEMHGFKTLILTDVGSTQTSSIAGHFVSQTKVELNKFSIDDFSFCPG